jgi:hypothetical protein
MQPDISNALVYSFVIYMVQLMSLFNVYVFLRNKQQQMKKRDGDIKLATWNFIFLSSFAPKVITITCWIGIRDISSFFVPCVEGTCGLTDQEISSFRDTSVIWVIGCLTATFNARIIGHIYKMPSDVKQTYYTQSFVSIAAQLLFTVGGFFYYGDDYLTCCLKEKDTSSPFQLLTIVGLFWMVFGMILDYRMIVLLKNHVINHEYDVE